MVFQLEGRREKRREERRERREKRERIKELEKKEGPVHAQKSPHNNYRRDIEDAKVTQRPSNISLLLVEDNENIEQLETTSYITTTKKTKNLLLFVVVIVVVVGCLIELFVSLGIFFVGGIIAKKKRFFGCQKDAFFLFRDCNREEIAIPDRRCKKCKRRKR